MDQPAAEVLITIARAADVLGASLHQTASLAETGVFDADLVDGHLMVTRTSVEQYRLRSNQ